MLIDPRRLRTPYALLTRHFLHQFLENDLVSPDSDRKQLLAVVGAMVMCLTLFISTMMSFAYVVGPLMTPGLAAVLSLTDKHFYLALAMVATALVAVSQWDALAIDARDAAILEPLPIPASTVRRAKLSAVAILGAVVSVAVNLCASIIFPALLVFTFRQMPFVSMLALMVTHLVVTVAAAAFGYLVIVALRETLVAILGGRLFTRASPIIQGALIVVLGGSLLLLPAVVNNTARRGFDGWRAMSPPMWFLGAYEMAVGGLIVDLPRAPMRPRQVENDRISTALYRERQPQFPGLARRAGLASGAILLLGALAYLWNARRQLSLTPAIPLAVRHRQGIGGRLANAMLLRHAAARAGFYFAAAAMWRNSTHRLTLACAAAAGFAMAIVALTAANAQPGAGPSPRLLAMQPLLYGALLVGFRHLIRVPAELRANWGFQLAWRGRERAFVAGVKWAAVVGLVLPALAVLLPLFVFVLGAELALVHALLGLAGAMVLLEALMVNYYDKVPFTCTYIPSENMKALGPIYGGAFLIGASIFARMESEALRDGTVLNLLVTLAVVFAVLRLLSAKRPRLRAIEFDEAPVTFQRLGLDA